MARSFFSIASLPKEAFLSPGHGYRPRGWEIALASLAINLLALALSLVTLQVYDRILIYHNISTLNMLCIGAVVALLVEALLKLCRGYAMGWSAASFEHAVACNVVRHTLARELTSDDNVTAGEYLQRIQSVGKIRDFYSGQALATLIDLPFVLVFLFIIYQVAGVLVFAPLLVLTGMLAMAYDAGRRLKSSLNRRDKADDTRYDFLVHTLAGIHSIKGLGLEAPFERRYEHWQAKTTRANFEVAQLSARTYDQGIIASHAMMIAVAVVGAPFMIGGSLSLGGLVACVMLSGRIMQPVQRALGFWTGLQEIGIAHQKLAAHFTGNLLSGNAAQAAEREGRVKLDNVSFGYDAGDSIVHNLSLAVRPGEVVSITGEYGAGKQTLLKLIAGVHPPHKGRVEVDGIAPHLYTSEALCDHIGYLPGNGIIFHGTIGENLSRFGRVPEDRVKEICELLGLEEEISMLPAGYDTRLEGTNADTIPPGLRQRIAIARVLASKPRVLLFYNADRSLDKDGYNHVYRLLARLKGRITMILVTNDQNLLRLADTHYRLENRGLLPVSAEGDMLNVHAYQEMRL